MRKNSGALMIYTARKLEEQVMDQAESSRKKATAANCCFISAGIAFLRYCMAQ